MQLKEEVVELIYNVALGESKWTEVVKELKKEFKAKIGFMLIMRPVQDSILISSIHKDHHLWNSQEEDYFSIAPWQELLISGKISPNSCYSCNTFTEDKNDKDHHTDFWKPHSLYYACGGLFYTKNKVTIVFGFPREKAIGTYEEHEMLLMTFYGRQVARAIDLEGVFGNSLPYQIYEDILTTRFSLSKAESKLVLELFKCGSLPKASESLNRSYHTVRNQMKSVLKKTETSNQIELFKLIINIS